MRFNLAKDKLENIILQDRWSANQEYVPNSLELRTVEDVKTWTGDVSAQEYLDSFHVLNNGFDLKIKTLQKLMYINYKTRLKSSVKESTDPINAVWLAANNDNKLADNYRATISLVGGKGKAVGEAEDIPTPTPEPLKPTPKPETDGEKPKETPKEEKPKNEIPKETPKEEKPKNEIPKETPKVETPKETEKPTPKEETKETPKEDEKPKEETPKTEDKPKENKPKVEQPKSDTLQKEEPKKDEEPKTENKKQANENTLPNTGTESNSMFTILSVICFMLGIKLKRTEN